MGPMTSDWTERAAPSLEDLTALAQTATPVIQRERLAQGLLVITVPVLL